MMLKLMVVDDEIEICDFLKSFFRDRKFEVTSAGNGDEALLLMENEKPHIVILDLKMPVMGGMEMMKMLFEKSINTCIIVVSSISDDIEIEQAKNLGAKLYLTKPILLEDLEQTVNEMAVDIRSRLNI